MYIHVHICTRKAWLHKLQPCSGEDVLVILNKYVKNAVDLKMPVRSCN